jgi:hypothetical protein
MRYFDEEGVNASYMRTLVEVVRAGSPKQRNSALTEMKRTLRMFKEKKATELNEEEIGQLFEAADRYIAAPENKLSMAGILQREMVKEAEKARASTAKKVGKEAKAGPRRRQVG